MKLKLKEYKGKYQIVQGFVGKDGEFKPEWCKKKKWSENERKMVLDDKEKPLSVYLGTKENAIDFLVECLDELGYWEETGKGNKPTQDTDVPF